MGYRYRGPHRRRYGRGIWGLPFTIFFIIMIVTHSFSGFIVALVVFFILAAIFRAVLPNMFNSGNMRSNSTPPYQQPQQPYYQPPEQAYQPYQPTDPAYQPYQQGYQAPPPVYQPPEQSYQPPDQTYQYQPPQQPNYEEQPQAEYPQEMPPMQQK